jgi:hypothetical protein
MKKLLLVIALSLVAGVGGYFAYYCHATVSTRAMLTGPGGELEWLRAEYHLSEAQFARVREIHADYAPKCDVMCEKIAKANGRFHQLSAVNRTFTPEVDEAMRECARVQAECRQALLQHVYAVSAEMPPEDGRRFLKMMTARLVGPGLGHHAVIQQSSK